MKDTTNISYFFRNYLFRIIDCLIIIACGYIVYKWRFTTIEIQSEYKLFIIGLIFLTLNIFSWLSLYKPWRGSPFFKELTNITLAFICITFTISLIAFATKSGANFSRLWAGWTLLSSFIGITSYRFIVRLYLRKARISGKNLKHVVIVGAGALGKRACDSMLSKTWAGFKPVAFFDDNKDLKGKTHQNIPIKGKLDDVSEFIEACRLNNDQNKCLIDQVWIALPMRNQQRIEELQSQLQNTATNVFFIPDLYGFNLANYTVEEKIGLPIMNMSASPMEGKNALLKRLEDIVISCALLVPLIPIFLIIALLIKKESTGPTFFKQRRYGVDGKEISVWKFRSMKVTEDGDEVKQAQRGDSRVTKVGGFLRKSSLDELPQLINVLQGTMSLVGPRPHAVAHNEFYRDKVEGYMARHKMRPGITGWAQVNGCRGETSEVSQMEERVRYDLEYIRNWSIGLDFRILFRTIFTVIDTKDTY